MPIQTRFCVFLAMLGLLAGCTAPEQRPSGGDRGLSPQTVVADPQRFRGHLVQWGGQIVSSHNFRDHSELEILAYPLRANGRPDQAKGSLGRFYALRSGYVETAEFAPGELVTVVGPVSGVRVVHSGSQSHPYPELEIQRAYLWKAPEPYSKPSVHFGIGVGSWGSGVGVGVGF